MDVASLQVIIKTQGVEAAQRELDKLSKTAGNAEKSTKDLTSSFGGLKTALATIGIAEAAKQYVQMADSMKLLEARIKLVSSSSDNYKAIQSDMTRIANENGIAIKNVGELYTKLSTALKPLGVTTSSVMAVTDAFSKTLLISGASTEEASSATLQFAQAMASGRLQGDEFRSMAENSPRFMKAMTDSLGKTSAELRQMAEDGKLTSSVVGGALVDSMAKLREEARSMPMTVGKAFNELKNEATLTVEQFDKLTGVNDSIAKGFQAITEKVVNLREALPKLSAEMTEWEKRNEKGLYILKAFGNAAYDITEEAVKGTGKLLKTSAEGWANIGDWMLYGLGEGAEKLGLVDDQTLRYVETQKKLQIESEKTAKAQKDMAKSIEDELDAVLAKEQFKNIALPTTEVKKQLKDSLDDYATYYKTIGDNETYLAIKRQQYIEKYKDLTTAQINEMVNAERDKIGKVDKLNEDWNKRKLELIYENEIAQSDEIAKPFIQLEKKYQEDLEKFKGVQGAKEELTRNYYIEAQRLQDDAVKKFNKKQEEELKKSVEWQVKIFEASEKLNDQLFEQREKMYGEDSARQIEAWYQNQLEMLGKLAIEGKATEKEISGLLAQIEAIKTLKIEETTLSFKVEKTFYNSFEKNLADSIESGFKDANLKSFFRSIGKDIWSSVASYSANNITSLLRGGASLGALAIGSSVSASEIATIMNSGGTFDSATNTITTSGGTKLKVGDTGSATVSSTGSDIMNLVNIVSTLKTAYTVATAGLSNTVMGGFMGISDALVNAGMVNAGTGVANFGAGFANPFSYSGASGLGTVGAGISSGLLGGAVGYGTGWLGDKLLGANSYASIGGLAGGALGGIGASLGMFGGPVGIIAGSLIGSALGGIFGKKKETDSGIQFFKNLDSLDTLSNQTVRAYQDWEKKGWFSKSSGTELSDLSSSQMKQIEAVFDTYDYLLVQLGDSDKIFLEAGKYSKDTFQDALAKNFITAFTDVNQATDDAIYQAWKDYAESIDKTVTEALTSSISAFVTEKRTFEIWQVGASSVEGLAKKAQFAKEDLDNLANSLGVTGVTVENYLQRYNEAIKESFTPETITSWKNLGDALMSATDAQKAYTDALSEAAAIATAAEDTYRKQILANQATNAKNIDTVFKNLSLQGLTVAQTFKELTNKEAPKTIKEWEAVGEELKKTEQVLSNEILTAFQNIGAELKQAVANTKLLSSSLLNAGDGLGALKTLMSLKEFKYSDFGEGDKFNANAFNVAYAKKEMENASRLAQQTSENALSMQNAMQTFNTLSSKIKETALSEYGVLFAENYKTFAYGFAEAATGSKELTTSFNNLVGISNELAKSYAYEQGMAYVPNGQGIATLQNAMMQASIVSQSAYSSRMGKMLYGMEEIALDKTFATLAGELRRGTISADEYSRSLEFINNKFANTIALMEDTEAQLKRIADAQYTIWKTAVSSTEFYFTKINEQADAYVATLKETTEGYKGATEAIGRLNSLTEVLAFTSSNINIEGMRNYIGGNADLTQEAYVKSTATLISSAAKLLSSEITTADAKQAAEAIKQKSSFAGVDALKIRDLSLAFENLSAYDATSLEGTLSLLNKELINKNITDAQYVDLFNIGLDIYRDVEQKQLNTLKSIERIVADISAYQRELLYGDLSTLSLSEKYEGAKDDTMGLYAQAKTALMGGDLDLFETLFNDFKGVSTNFLTVSKDFVANNEAYVQDFTSVFGALADLKSLATTSGLNVVSDLNYLKLDGSHANGLDYVPFDGYIAQLHKGERVQTANDARSTDALASEIRLLRQDLKDSNQTIAFNTQRTAKILDRWDADGQPEERVV